MKQTGMEYIHKIWQAYSAKCKILCHGLKLPQTAFDILMFLGNYPQYSTARDISEVRGIKANLISVNVDKLVQAGYLQRKSLCGDRRKISLFLTDKALPVIEDGRRFQHDFKKQMFSGISENDMLIFQQVMERSQKNLDNIIQGNQ